MPVPDCIRSSRSGFALSRFVKSMWLWAGGCVMHLTGFDGFFLYCSGAQWAPSTVETYWSQSASEGGEAVSSLQQTFTQHCAFLKGNSYDSLWRLSGDVWRRSIHVLASSACHMSACIHFSLCRYAKLSSVILINTEICFICRRIPISLNCVRKYLWNKSILQTHCSAVAL